MTDAVKNSLARTVPIALALTVSLAGCGTKPDEDVETGEPPDWPRFRGASGDGIADCEHAPVKWDATSGEGVVWKVPVPMKGASSPVIAGGRVFVTGADKRVRKVFAYDARTGEPLWQRRIENVPGGGHKPGKIWKDYSYAAPTPAADGRRVYAMFSNGDLAAVDLDGRVVWSRGFGPLNNPYGHASSPVIDGGRLFILLDQNRKTGGEWRSMLLALDPKTGETMWEAKRQVPASWTTPVVVERAGGRQVITAADPWVMSYDAADGSELWRAEVLDEEIGPSPVHRDGVVYVAMEGCDLSAIRADGEGDVSDTHLVWQAEGVMPSIPSPLATDEAVFVLSSDGVLSVFDRAGGEAIQETDLECYFSASPSFACGRLYLFSEDGEAFVLEVSAAPEPATRQRWEVVARNPMGEAVHATPAFSGNMIYVRGESGLFCLGTKGDAK